MRAQLSVKDNRELGITSLRMFHVHATVYIREK